MLKLIFEASLLGGEFPEWWKGTNVALVHKKSNKSSSDFWKNF